MQSWYRQYGGWLLGVLFAVAFSVAGSCLWWALAEPWEGRLPTLAYVSRLPRSVRHAAAAPVTGGKITERLQRAGATMGGDLEISLAWDGLSDFDLQVRTPSGELIEAEHWQGVNGGVQDVDANPTLVDALGQIRINSGQPPGAGTIQPLPEFLVDMDRFADLDGSIRLPALPSQDGKAPTRFTRHPIEHTYFERATTGTYLVYVHCYSWRETRQTPLAYTVQARSHGKVFYEQSGVLGPASYAVEGVAPVVACHLNVP